MHITPYELSKLFTPNQLVGQFLLSQKQKHIPADWDTYSHNNWLLGTSPSQKVIPIKDSTNNITGWFIGHPIDPDLEDFIETATFPKLPTSYQDPFQSIESYIDKLLGRYLFIGFHSSDNARVYMDSVGALSAVYSPSEHIVAANPMLIPYQSADDDHLEHLKLIDPANQNRSFHFGLTPRRSLYRLLPNHYLDLKAWQATRHWPKTPFLLTANIPATLEKIIEVIQSGIKASIKHHRPYLSLTAGRDSRTLLACAKHWIKEIDCFTWEIPDAMAQEDVNIARELSDRNNFFHFSIPYNESSEHQKLLWLYRTGCSAGELRGMKIVPSANALDNNRPHLISLNAEIGRSHLNKPHHKKFKQLNPETIARRVGQLLSDEFISAAETWLEPLRNYPVDNILDLAFLEQRLGCWVAVTGYGHAESAFRAPPFSSRELYQIILSLPLTYRQQDKMPEDIIKMAWKELLNTNFSGK